MALMKFRQSNQVRWVGTRPAHDGTQVLTYGTAVNAVDTFYTVPPGQVFYLTHVMWGYTSIAVGLTNLAIQDAVPAVISYCFYEVILATSEGKSGGVSYWPPIEMIEGWRLRLQSNAAGLTVRAAIHGWVE